MQPDCTNYTDIVIFPLIQTFIGDILKPKYYIEQNIKSSSVTNYHYWNTRITEHSALVELECNSISEAIYNVMTSNKFTKGESTIYKASEESLFFLEPILKVDTNISAFTLTPLPPKDELYVLLYFIGDTGVSYIGSNSKIKFSVGMRSDKLNKESFSRAYYDYCEQHNYVESLERFKYLTHFENMLFDYYGERLI